MVTKKDNPDALGINTSVKRDGVIHKWTQHELIEYQKCMADPIYFCENYVKVISLDEGLVPFMPYDYQKKMLRQFQSNRFNIVLACRQSGKSIGVVAFLLWYVIFHPEKTVAVLANKGPTAREMLRRFQLMLENLPFFLQPGTKILNRGSIEFSNNSMIFAESTSSDSIRGRSANLVYLDEFAFVENAEEFYTSTYPTITSGTTTKVIITSTANGIGNTFYYLWEKAQLGKNEFKPLRVDWWDVPGRDEEWKQQTINNTSEIQFQQEFGNSFIGTGDTLIDGATLQHLTQLTSEPKEIHGAMKIYEQPKSSHRYVLAVDVGHGGGGDYSVISILDVTEGPFKLVGAYRSNRIPPMLFPTEIAKWAKIYNYALVIVENNDQGAIVCNNLYHDIEYDNMYVESVVKANGIGLNMTRKTKAIGCSNLKEIIEAGRLLIPDKETVHELTTFVAKGNSFEAREGNYDDTVMSLVGFSFVTTTGYFLDLTDMNMRSMLYKQRIKEMEDDLPPFGIIGDKEPYSEALQVDTRVWDIDDGGFIP